MYETNDGLTRIEVKMNGETIWLNVHQMAELFDRDSKTIRKHIKNIGGGNYFDESLHLSDIHFAPPYQLNKKIQEKKIKSSHLGFFI